MNLDYLIQILQNKIQILNNAKNMAFANGDMETINSVDKQLYESQTTLSQLQLLLTATQAATATNADLATVVTAGVVAAQNAVTLPNDPTSIINGYDISSYATDPLYEHKIRDMLSTMPEMDSAPAIDAYIAKEVVGSPLTGQMILTATGRYAVDTRLTMAIMELDSRFGTAGVGAVTFNPGNVGNTGSATQTYASWDDGVSAVASWLNNHRVTPIVTPVVPPPAPTPPTPIVVDTPAPVPVQVMATSTPPTIVPEVTAITTPDILTPLTTASSTPTDLISDIIATTTDTINTATSTAP